MDAEHHLRHGRPGPARAAFTEAVRGLSASQEPTSPMLSRPLKSLGDAELALGRRAAAVVAYQCAWPCVSPARPRRQPFIEAGLAAARGASGAAVGAAAGAAELVGQWQ